MCNLLVLYYNVIKMHPPPVCYFWLYQEQDKDYHAWDRTHEHRASDLMLYQCSITDGQTDSNDYFCQPGFNLTLHQIKVMPWCTECWDFEHTNQYILNFMDKNLMLFQNSLKSWVHPQPSYSLQRAMVHHLNVNGLPEGCFWTTTKKRRKWICEASL